LRNILANFFIIAYANLIKFYPVRFRETFAEEMISVFEETINRAARRGFWALIQLVLIEFLSAPSILFRVYRDYWLSADSPWIKVRYKIAQFFRFPASSARLDGRDSWKQASLEMALFLIMGLVLILQTYLPFEKSGSGWQRSFEIVEPVILLVTLPILIFGLIKGLPRWAFPPGGILLGYCVIAGLIAQLFPFILVIFLAISGLTIASVWVHSHHHPLPTFLRWLGSSLSLDLTRLSFAFYAVTPSLIILAYDDAQLNNRTPYLAISAICMTVGALGFVRSHKPYHQILALLTGVSLAIWLAFPDKVTHQGGIIYWMSTGRTWAAETGWMFRLWIIAIIFLLTPAGIGIARGRLEPG